MVIALRIQRFGEQRTEAMLFLFQCVKVEFSGVCVYLSSFYLSLKLLVRKHQDLV